MGFKRDLKRISDYADNPYNVDYRPEKENIRLFVILLVLLAIGIGLCYSFIILVVGPLSIYLVIMLWKCKACWKELGWKMIWFWLPLIGAIVLGFVLLATHSVFNAISSFFALLGFKT